MGEPTKGPWTVVAETGEIYGGVDGDETLVAAVYGGSSDEYLIAAAPNLFEALTEMRSVAASMAAKAREVSDDKSEIFWCRKVDKCDAALLKASHGGTE